MWHYAWPSIELTNLERSLTRLVEVANDSTPERGDEVNGAIARFLVIRTCGYVEQVVEICCKSYIESKTDPRTRSFGLSWFGRGNNPTPARLVELVHRFDIEWSAQLEDLLKQEDELLWRELTFLVSRRNRIAHGLSEGVGTRKALDLVEHARRVSDWFIATFDPR